MPKKFANENPKVTAARDRKATAKKDEADRKQKAADDAYWADDDKNVNRKLQRKDDEERKRLEAIKRKEENKKLADAEMSALAKKPVETSAKVTRSAIDKRKELELKLAQAQEEQRRREAQKIEVQAETVEENLNKLDISTESARNVDDALKVLGSAEDELDKHPEKRMKAAYLSFEETRLPQLKKEHPTFRLSQLKQQLKKEWMKSPENPINAKLLAMSSK